MEDFLEEVAFRLFFGGLVGFEDAEGEGRGVKKRCHCGHVCCLR